MKHILIYSTVIMLGLALASPALAAIVLPTVPGTGGQALTGSGVVNVITQVFNWLVTISTIVAIGFFIYGGIRYAMGGAEAGKDILKNSAIGLAFILGVGLVVNTIAGLINRGLNLG